MLFFNRQKNINLIPEEERKSRVKKIRIITIAVLAGIVLFELLILAAIFGLESREQNRKKQLLEESTQLNAEWQSVAEDASSLKNIKQQAARYTNFTDEYFVMDDKVKLVRSVIPNGITLTTLEIDMVGSVSLSGVSENPATILQLMNVLSDREDDFSSTILSNAEKLSESSGYSFDITTQLVK